MILSVKYRGLYSFALPPQLYGCLTIIARYTELGMETVAGIAKDAITALSRVKASVPRVRSLCGGSVRL